MYGRISAPLLRGGHWRRGIRDDLRPNVRRGRVWISGLFGGVREHTYRDNEIADITFEIRMQVGSTPYYDIKLVRSDRKKIRAGRSIRDKREAEWAEWLVGRMNQALGRATNRVPAGTRAP